MNPWLDAFRPRTLPLAMSGIVVGSGLAAWEKGFRWPVFLLALLTAVLLQVLSNLANDLGDHLHGTDNHRRVGPERAVQSGAITPAAMKRAIRSCGMLSLASGLTLIIYALGLSPATLVFLLMGLAAIAAAVRYTYGSHPYGYVGLGDLSVFVFFGLLGVGGTFFLHVLRFDPVTLLPAAGIGLLATGVLNLNNMRDAVNDAASGKRTVAMRLGPARAKVYHAALVLVGFASLVVFTAVSFRSWWQYLFVVTFPFFDRHLRTVLKNREPRDLDPQLKVLALSTLVGALLFSLGLVLAT